MEISDWALLISGGMIIAGIAYPTYAQSKPGWKVGAWSGGPLWSLWFGMGALAYLGGMANTFGWLALLGAIPLALVLGFAMVLVGGRHAQIAALSGPIFANLWVFF
ncbi:hypothetical protein [Qipengyuania nanhaisediminis]|uniref:hypothetical protein n=1 Tax=Qipengyuania nanhaisediminis TaxID=604088 RepID=UPI0038B2E6D2